MKYFQNTTNFRVLFFQIVAAVWVSASIGSAYIFSLFSPYFKETFGYNQSQVTTISTVGLSLAYFIAPLAGVLYDRAGPKATLVVSAAIYIVGYSVMALILNGQIPHSVGLLCVAYLVCRIAPIFGDTASMMPVLYSFHADKGKAIVMQKTMIGLGISVYSFIQVAFFKGQVVHFTYFVMSYGAFLSLVGAVILFKPTAAPARDPIATKRFTIAIGILIAFLVYDITVSNVLTYNHSLGSGGPKAFAIVALLFVLSFTVTLLPASPDGDVDHERSGLLPQPEEGGNKSVQIQDEDAGINCKSFRENVLGIDLWLLWWVCFGAWGSGAVVTANLADVYHATCFDSFSHATNASLVSVFGAGNALGRIIGGMLDGRLKHLSLQYPLMTAMSAIGFGLFLVLPCKALGVAVFIFGTAFGWSWAATSLIVRATYHKAMVGTYYNFLYTSACFSTVVMNYALFGKLFDREAAKQPHGGNVCRGHVCFSTSFAIITGINFTVVVAAYVWHRRWSRARDNLANDAASTPQ